MSTAALPQADLGLHDWLERVVAGVGSLVYCAAEATDAARIEVIRLLEQLAAATTAAQAAEMVRFADAQADRRGVADQIALACGVSPSEGSRRLGTARALVRDLPETLVALSTGAISAETARLVAAETSHLDHSIRGEVEHRLHRCDLSGFSAQQVGRHARRLAYEADPEAAVERCRQARGDRRVTLRRARDTMAMLTGVLPAEQGVACWEALRRHADGLVAAGDERGRGQILADTMVERITGQTAAPEVPVEVGLVVPVEALIDHDSPRPSELTGYGPVPAELVRELLLDSPAKRWWRRVFTAPAGEVGDERAVVGGDPRRRRFSRRIARILRDRDQVCRDPFCDAPIRHLDHVWRHADGGPTEFSNARGVCVRGNLVRELPGWQVRLRPDRRDVVVTTTPTGHRYVSRAPQPP